MKSLAFIPARSGSTRIPNKNIQLLNGKPLIYWAIKSALESNIFVRVVVSTDSIKYAEMSKEYGAEVVLEPSPTGQGDIKWVTYALKKIDPDMNYEVFSILRPTSPFRTAETIKRAWDVFTNSDCDSLRAVEKCSQHPYKMWLENGEFIRPFMPTGIDSMPYQSLPAVYVQNASLEIAHSYVIYSIGSISGNKVVPFYTQGYEGFDINNSIDLDLARLLIAKGEVTLG